MFSFAVIVIDNCQQAAETSQESKRFCAWNQSGPAWNLFSVDLKSFLRLGFQFLEIKSNENKPIQCLIELIYSDIIIYRYNIF